MSWICTGSVTIEAVAIAGWGIGAEILILHYARRMQELLATYQSYLDCLNAQDWSRLGNFVHDEVSHNGRPFGLAGYRAMLESDFQQIPDLQFKAELLVCQPPFVAARLWFNCSPKGNFLGLALNGRTVSFAENIFYEFDGDKIKTAWSVLDKAAIEDQLP